MSNPKTIHDFYEFPKARPENLVRFCLASPLNGGGLEPVMFILSGGAIVPTCKEFQPHVIINLSNLSKRGISEQVAQLYALNHSIQAISKRLGISRWKASSLLEEREKRLQKKREKRKFIQEFCAKKPRARVPRIAPYGYCLIDGRLVVDPKEDAIVQTIERGWRRGMSHRAIAKQLNGQKFKPRRASTWSQTLISSIIKRLSNQEELP